MPAPHLTISRLGGPLVGRGAFSLGVPARRAVAHRSAPAAHV